MVRRIISKIQKSHLVVSSSSSLKQQASFVISHREFHFNYGIVWMRIYETWQKHRMWLNGNHRLILATNLIILLSVRTLKTKSIRQKVNQSDHPICDSWLMGGCKMFGNKWIIKCKLSVRFDQMGQFMSEPCMRYVLCI